jgi:hypothetical protein
MSSPSRVADRALQAGHRWALNKYNPDDLLTQLVQILEKADLDDAVQTVKKVTPAIQRAWRTRDASNSRVASRHLEARNPPFHEAAEADEAMGEAYRSLVALKMGFDSWEEIPKSAQPLYKEIGKAMAAVGKAREDTYQVRMMVQRKRYGSGSERVAAKFLEASPEERNARYAKNVATVRGIIDRIAALLTTHESKQAADTKDWGYSGDLDHVQLQLASVESFLTDDRG